MYDPRFILLFLLIAISITSFAQSSIEWGRPVVYADFQARPERSDTAAASISVTISLGYAKTRNGNLKYRVSAVMAMDESWIKEEFRTESVLSHEQGHFDIAHIYAKQLEAVLKTRPYAANDVSALQALYDSFLEKMNALQLQYDNETKGGADLTAQIKWKKFIESKIVSSQDQ